MTGVSIVKQWEPVLAQCPIFKNLSSTEILHILEDIPYITEEFEKGKILYRAEESSHRIGIILSGCLEMRKYLSTGNAVTLFQRRGGEMIGGSIVFSSCPKYPCDVIAREKSFLLWIHRNIVLDIFLKNRVIASNLLRISADRIMQLEKRWNYFHSIQFKRKSPFHY